MGCIQVLSPELVNRIAAGECVERPASVVKELVENALDAGAARIDVSVLDGGRELIEVRDDGCGMDPDDLRLCVQAHATSKLRDDDDLFRIRTLGFRGEALPSIGAVARLTITSRTPDADVAHRIDVDAGLVSGPTPCAAPPGTTVAVRDLFHRLPARRKFLRTNATEMGQIGEQFVRLALAQASVAFTLRHQSRSVHSLVAAQSAPARIADLFGADLATVLLPVQREGSGVRVTGWVAPPAECRGSGKWEYVFVNGRYIRDRFVGHAVKEAYRSLIDPSRYPVVFLYLSVDPQQVDVNVHPTKIEVRWRDANYVHGQVLAALRERFLSSPLDAALRMPSDDHEHRERVRQAMVEFFTSRGVGPARVRAEAAGTPARPAFDHVDSADPSGSSIPPGLAPQIARGPAAPIPLQPAPGARGCPPMLADSRPDGDTLVPEGSRHAPAIAPLLAPGSAARPAVQIHRTYLVVETEDGVMIIDQHALHERILYEELQRRITDRPLESQRLLLPEVLNVPGDRLEAVELHAEVLARLGIDLTVSGPGSVTLHAFPSLLERADRLTFVRDLLDRLSERQGPPRTDGLLHELLDMVACKAAVKAGDALTPEEIAALLARRELAERSSNCPHGRPTTLRLTLRELERQFHRR
jgi:DNA mismatch repair protein MutL